NLPAKVLVIGDVSEAVVAAEAGVGLGSEDAMQQGVLRSLRIVCRCLEGIEMATHRRRDDLADPVQDEAEDGTGGAAKKRHGCSEVRVRVWPSWLLRWIAPVAHAPGSALPALTRPGSPAARCVSKNSRTRRSYSAPATCRAWLCLAPSTSQNSFGWLAWSNS